jgi:Fe-S cluster biogenesis protein NfuA
MSSTQQTATFDDLARHIDELRDQVSHLDPRAQELLRDTIEAITEFNKAGLVALVHLLREDARGGELLYEAVERPEVMALFVTHGIIRTDRTIDVLRVVEGIRPYLVASSIEMDVETVRDDIAYVRFATGCSAPDQATKDEIMGVIRQRVPGLVGVQEIVPEPGKTFIGLDTLRVGPA